MKFLCTKSNLLKGVSIASKAVPSKTTMPILECFMINAYGSTIKITANDMEIGIETVIEGMVIENGSIAVNARLFSDIIRKLPDNEVCIQIIENNQVKITCEKARFVIGYKNIQEFSALPDVIKNHSITISQYSLKKIIGQTIFSIAENESNLMMTGECFEVSGNNLKITALDSCRISIRNISLKEIYEKTKCIVPGKTLNDLTKIIEGDMDKDVEIYFSSNHIMFEFEDTKVVSRVIEGEFFKIDQMLSFDYQVKVRANKNELYDSIDRATLLINESDKKPLVMDIKDDHVGIKIKSFSGTMNEEVEILKEGKDLMIAFNPKFIKDALRAIDDEEVSLYMVNAKNPCIIKDENESYIYMILPVNFIPEV